MTRTPCIAALLLFITNQAFAGDATWPLNGRLATAAQNNEQEPEITSDGAGGAIVVWMDSRTGQGYDIWCQRFDAWGREVWAADGVMLCSAANDQWYPQITSDGSGGAIVVWEDDRAGSKDIYARRVDASGNAVWTANGVAICTLAQVQNHPRITSDGAGGAVIAWTDFRSATNGDIYAQRINGAGTVMWPADGRALCTAANTQDYPCLTGDGYGNTIVAWQDPRGANQDIYAQGLDPTGLPMWAGNGSPVCTANGVQQLPQIAPNGVGGAIIVWQDNRTVQDSFAQLMNANGTTAWTLNGVSLSSATGEYEQQIVTDGARGAIVTWTDTRGGTGDIYMQRIGPTGTLLWNAAAVPLCNAPGHQGQSRIVADGIGGAVVSWVDQRYESGGDIFARRVDASGSPLGPTDGIPLCVVPLSQMRPPITTDGKGGAIVTWEDGRTQGREVYVQRLDRYDNWGYPSPDIASALDIPGDQGGQVNVAWDASRLDPWPNQDIDRYTVWRAIDAAMAGDFADAGVPMVTLDQLTPMMSKAIRTETVGAQALYWELMATVDAYYLDGYAQPVATLFDSTAASPNPHHFQVIAHGFMGPEYWVSAPETGRSLDNIAPASPLMLTAQLVGDDVLLVWNPSAQDEVDFNDYAVYRATSSGVQPVPDAFLSGTIDTTLTDSNPPSGFVYYIVTARDVHENQSVPSNEASVTIPTGIGDDTPALAHLAVDANYPNPFNASTEIQVGLPRAGDLRLEVFDVAGRRVASREMARMPAGWQRIPFDGRDARGRPLASGVYFAKVTAGGESRSIKLVIHR